jgi:hypothetical protein
MFSIYSIYDESKKHLLAMDTFELRTRTSYFYPGPLYEVQKQLKLDYNFLKLGHQKCSQIPILDNFMVDIKNGKWPFESCYLDDRSWIVSQHTIYMWREYQL